MSKSGMQNPWKELRLSFKGCGEQIGYRAIKLDVPKGYELKKVVADHGFCEYQFWYDQGTVLYISSNIYTGSQLNYENRLYNGTSTYSQERKTNDTIKVSGKQKDELYWMEFIQGNHVIGYINSPDSTLFRRTVNSVDLLK